MELHARLIHTEPGLRVVEVRASRGEYSLGSTLAEAGTAQEAEDLAVARLLQRLRDAERSDESIPLRSPPPVRRPAPAPVRASSEGDGLGTAPAPRARVAPQGMTEAATNEAGATESIAAGDLGQSALEIPAPPGARPGAPEPMDEAMDEVVDQAAAGPPDDPQEEPPADPEDWSQELTAIDLQLRRLGWNREQEGTYLQRAFGHPSRSRLTRYSDLRAYLTALEALERGSDPAVAAVPLRRSELLAQGDALLVQLGWNAERGRAFLERELNRISRQQLSDVELLQFNMLLEGELLTGGAPLSPAAPDRAQR
jgi:hypothetical protein